MTNPDAKLLRVLRGELVEPSPMWLMRQAGRYLPEYRATRAEAGSFLDLCFSPKLAAEVTLQPIRRFGFDAAILFSDILVIPWALGQSLTFVEGEGPRLDPVDSAERFASLSEDGFLERLEPVFEAIALIKAQLPAETPLIGFAGAPWTLATYVIGGRGSTDHAPAKALAAADPGLFAAILDQLTRCVSAFLTRQVAAGVDVVKVFDSWAGSTPAPLVEEAVIAPTTKIAAHLRETASSTPLIAFPRGLGLATPAYARAVRPDGLALDTPVRFEDAKALVQGPACLQGNLDPLLLLGEEAPLLERVAALKAASAGAPHIFNLGHGITPTARISNVEAMIRAWRSDIS
ncbi:MAG: uroporphyrinogen decarboxylase [Pseudomonadota bacterium]